MPYIRSIRRTPLGAPGGIHKRKKIIDFASTVACGALGGQLLDVLILGISHGEGLSGRSMRQILETCKLPATLDALLLLEGESAGFRALDLCVKNISSGASNALALAASSVSNLPYLLPDARRGRRMGSSSALDPLLLGDIPMPIGDYTGHGEWVENTLLKAHKKHGSGAFKAEIAEDAGDEFLENPLLRLSAPNLSQLVPTERQMAPLAEGACGVLLEKQPSGQALARIIGIQIAPDSDGDGQATLKVLREVSGFDPLRADRMDIVDPCASHPLRFINSAGIQEISKINPAGGALAMGYIPGAAGLRALATLVHGLQPGQTGLCFQFGNGWSAGILVKSVTQDCSSDLFHKFTK